MELTVVLNGTDTNPWYKYGLTQNPFPQIATAELAANCLRLQSLGGDPIPDTNYIRERLKGFSDEFVALCCKNFVKGKIIKFKVQW